ncbi:MAG: glycosyltransferase [Armatimonadota bacterium]|nr:glycosyltransferase [Armatimonadota bacterium]
MADPLVSIVIVNFNGRTHLPDCLGSLAQLAYPAERREIILVDNASTDGSPEWVRERFPDVQVIVLDRNAGFAAASNHGARAAHGRIVVFLNNDTRVDPQWLTELVAPLGGVPGSPRTLDPGLAATASKMLDWAGTGLDFPVFATWLGAPYAARDDRAFRRPSDYVTPQYLLFPSGGAMAMARDVFLDVGGFDADYFMYHEDVDLGWRLWLQGYKVLYVPTATVYHRSGASGGGDPAALHFLNERNALFTVVKNAGDAWLARVFPLMLLWIIERTGQYLGMDPAAFPQGGAAREAVVAPRGAVAGVAAAMALVRSLPGLLEKRRAVQARRVRSDEEIAALFELPRDAFIQMMTRAEIDFRQAAALVDTFGLAAGEVSIFGRMAYRIASLEAGGDPESREPRAAECLLFLADHTLSEAQRVFGEATLQRVARDLGLSAADLPMLARVLNLVGSRLLAQLVPPTAFAPAGPSVSGAGESPHAGVLALARDAVWRDAVFYREELEKRTDQVARLVKARAGRAAEPRVVAATGQAGAAAPTRWAFAAAVRDRARDLPLDVVDGVKGWLRGILPLRTKRWIKRVVLRQPGPAVPPGWGWAAQTPPAAPAADPVGARTTAAPARTRYDVIVFPVTNWHFRIQRPQQLARRFARHGHRVFYVSVEFDDQMSAPGAPAPYRMSRIARDIYDVRLPGPPRLNVYHDRVRPDVLDRQVRAFEALRRDHAIADAVSLVELPFWRGLATRLRERFGWRLVYDCLDRHAEFSTNRAAMVDEEAGLLAESDLVAVTSEALYEEHRSRTPRCVRIPNAADVDHFSVFVGEAPPWLQSLPRPVVGYHGAIAEWFDTALVAEMARGRPSWSFVLVGSMYTANMKPLAGLRNVYLPGEQPYARLPAFLHAFDVCLIPFKRSPLTDATDPVKFYEYLSAGKPVVSVTLPELQPHAAEGLVAFADDAQGFLEAVERALATDTPAEAARRRRWAERHTWDARYRQFADAIRDVYPRVSIVIPTHGNPYLTRLCLDSIARNTSWPHYEVIVVDNASSDGTGDFLRDHEARDPRVRCILNERNEGFARATNQGLAAASGEYLVLLNNDTIVTRGWLGTLVRYLEQHPDVGLVGPATNQVGNEARVMVDYTNIEEMEAFAARYTHDHADQARDLEMLAFFCVVMPRRVWQIVGPLDEQFGLGMFEDDDFCLRVRQAGYRVVCTDAAFVHHFHGATMRRLGDDAYVRLFEANRAKFEAKWGTRWTPHRYRWQR